LQIFDTAQVVQVSRTTALKVAKTLHPPPYKIRRIQMTEEGNYERRKHLGGGGGADFCGRYITVFLTFFTDEA
jgi:ribosomal protein L13E